MTDPGPALLPDRGYGPPPAMPSIVVSAVQESWQVLAVTRRAVAVLLGRV